MAINMEAGKKQKQGKQILRKSRDDIEKTRDQGAKIGKRAKRAKNRNVAKIEKYIKLLYTSKIDKKQRRSWGGGENRKRRQNRQKQTIRGKQTRRKNQYKIEEIDTNSDKIEQAPKMQQNKEKSLTHKHTLSSP